jgi:hypothetical protein
MTTKALSHQRYKIKEPDMRKLRLVQLIILAIGIASGIAANSASAAKITYSGSGRFTISSGASRKETVGGVGITCNSDLGTGQLGKSPATTAELTISFQGCELLGKKCKSSGGAAGLIDTVKLLATFGDVKVKEVGGALLKPASGTAFLIPVTCGETEISSKGSLIGEFTTKLDTQTKTFAVTFSLKTGEKGKQAITKFAGEEKTNVIELTIEGVTEVAGVESTETLTLEGGSGQLLA